MNLNWSQVVLETDDEEEGGVGSDQVEDSDDELDRAREVNFSELLFSKFINVFS